MNYPAASSGVSKTTTGKTLRPKGRGIHPDGNKLTREIRWKQLDEDLEYSPIQLDRDVVAPDQIRTIIRTFKDNLSTEIFPGREEVPKTLIFCKRRFPC